MSEPYIPTSLKKHWFKLSVLILATWFLLLLTTVIWGREEIRVNTNMNMEYREYTPSIPGTVKVRL
ncbi:MAG: hypothetical protein JWN64_532 [Parcubacteria group bacterium]|nr:hypothetical protein [Parcubacteria group bacterium]